MRRVVRGADGRVWTLQGEMEWRSDDPGSDFEHDFSSGNRAAVVMLFLVIVLFAVLIVWTPPDVEVPLWLVLFLVLVALFFPLRWTLRRPWTIVAATGDKGREDAHGRPLPEPEEKWVGTVRGVFNVRQQMAKIARSIADESMPAMEGPLKPAS